jgi:hypothetical protein
MLAGPALGNEATAQARVFREQAGSSRWQGSRASMRVRCGLAGENEGPEADVEGVMRGVDEHHPS